MTELSIPSVVEETKRLLGTVREALIFVARNLHFLRSNGEHEKFGQYVEEEFGIPQSMTSKLLRDYEAWHLKAGIPLEKLAGIDYEKLYGYIPLLEGKDPELAFAEVQSWSRKDIKDEKQEKAPCFHPSIQRCCTECWSIIND